MKSFALLKIFNIIINFIFNFVVVAQLLSHVQLFVTPWTAACQASLSFTISRSFLKFISLSQWHHPVETCFDKQDFWKRDMARERETRHKNSEKSKDRGTNTTPRWRCRNWIHASFVIFSASKEKICGELNYN